ncbi:MAG TPA: hypothetical protein VFO62_08360 [Candidatus Binatia bacterium]|nr:hypothetical protein [Candidatus Binatia bacterium]
MSSAAAPIASFCLRNRMVRLLCSASIVLIAWGCQDRPAGAVGPHAERFFAAIEPAARDCVLSAIDMDLLESALESMSQLPSTTGAFPHDLSQISTCTGAVELREGVARVILASLPEKRARLMLEQEDTPGDVDEIAARFAVFPSRLADRNRAQGFERRGPARMSVAYQRGDIAETPQVLMVDLLDRPGQHPPEWTAGELVAIAAFDARERLVAAGAYHGIAWARFSEVVDGTTIQVITWGDVDGRLLFRAEAASREVLAELLRAFRAGGLM